MSGFFEDRSGQDTEHLSDTLRILTGTSGRWVRIVRSTGRKCRCSEEGISKEARPDCEFCYGSGMVKSSRIVKVMIQIPSYDESSTQTSPVGPLNTSNGKIFFPPELKPRHDDRIEELDIDPDTGKPTIPYVVVGIWNVRGKISRKVDRNRLVCYVTVIRRADAET